MKKESYELFNNGSLEKIVDVLASELSLRNESPFWADKVVPFSSAILSVLLPLKEMDLLFNPEGEKEEVLTPELFFRWSDMVSLKSLLFTLQRSNISGVLERTKLANEICENYNEIDLSLLASYLSSCNINLEKESLDFPISSYNLHQGVSNVIKSLL